MRLRIQSARNRGGFGLVEIGATGRLDPTCIDTKA